MNDYCKEIAFEAIENFGAKKQVLKAIEELAELQVELAKSLNEIDSNIDEELGDVEYMLFQIKEIYNISKSEIDDCILRKAKRLEKRIKKLRSNKK